MTRPLRAGTHSERELLRRQRQDIKLGYATGEAPPEPKLPTREQCRQGVRPCPHASCRFHLLTDVTETGALRLSHAEDALTGMAETCSLDLSERGSQTLEDIAGVLAITRERVRQIEIDAIAKLADILIGMGVDEQIILEHLSQGASGEGSHRPGRAAAVPPRRDSANHLAQKTADEAANETLTALGLIGEDVTWTKRIVKASAQHGP